VFVQKADGLGKISSFKSLRDLSHQGLIGLFNLIVPNAAIQVVVSEV
jgi:hypothetical protein